VRLGRYAPAQYGEYVVQIELSALEILNGSLPSRAAARARMGSAATDELSDSWGSAKSQEPCCSLSGGSQHVGAWWEQAANSRSADDGREQSMFTPRLTRSIAIGAAAIALGGGAYGIVSATASTGSGTAITASSASPAAVQPASAGGGSNARSGPAAGGSLGTVSSVSTSGFTLSTSTGEKVAIKETSSTKYEKGTTTASKRAVTKGKTVVVLGTDDNATITATKVIVGPPKPNPKTASQVVAFNRGTGDKSKTVGQIPASYKQGTGTILSGTTANKATEAALLAYPGGVVDRVVKLSNGDYEVHNIGVNWPHHIFVSSDFKVIGAND
jgi:hypothetical protein